MIKNFLSSNIAMVGGGKFCKLFLESLYSDPLTDQRPTVLGMADVNSRAEGIQYARKLGIFTTSDYTDLYRLENLQILIELTNDVTIADVIRKKKLDASIETVSMDPNTMHGVLLNLMSNAIDACLFDEDTSKNWQVTLKTVHADNQRVQFEVTDNGAGMNEEIQQKLFTSFFSTKGHRGTGLGLMVTRKLIDEHHGTIAVKSQVKKGTTFTVQLPYKEPDAAK